MTWFAVIVVVAICHLSLASLLARNHLVTPPLPDAPSPQPPPSVYIVVPARNEAANIADCVRSLLMQDYENLRVRVIDDGSTDGTGDIVRQLARQDARLELLPAPKLPPGWLGKPHALHFGARELKADYLLFIDADVRLLPRAVRGAVHVAQKSGAGLVTCIPRLAAESFWERAVQPVVAQLVFGALDPVKVNSVDSEIAVGFGPFMFFRQSAYAAIGGHAAVGAEIVEDLRLAQRIKAARLRLCFVRATDAMSLRMYDSRRALVAGWKKNFHVALGSVKWLAPLCAVLLGLFYTAPVMTLALSGAYLIFVGGNALWAKLFFASLFCYGADWIGRLALARGYGITLRGARSFGGLVVAYILCASSYQSFMGRKVVWPGPGCKFRARQVVAGGLVIILVLTRLPSQVPIVA
jgi:glycosyltransferase involved in cell wall biosynthesis